LTESYGNPAVDRVPDIEALGWDMSFVPGAVNALLAWREAMKGGSPAVHDVPGAAGVSANEGATSSPSSPMRAAQAEPLRSSAPEGVGTPSLSALVASPPNPILSRHERMRAPKKEAERSEAGAAKKISPVIQPNVAPDVQEQAETAAEARKQIVEAKALPVPARSVAIPALIEELNGKHAVISNLGGKCLIMEWIPSLITKGGEEISYQTFGAFKDRYANRYIEAPDWRGSGQMVPLAPAWLAHPYRRQYEGLDLVPNGPAVLAGNRLNLWRRWGVEARKGEWGLMQRHIEEVLANGDPEMARYIVRWCAWVFQNAGKPPGVALALRGGKGTGKGLLGRYLMAIFGQHALQIFSPDHLSGKHNEHLQNKLFLFADEAFWAGDKTAERILKGMVTEPVMMIEPKGVNAFQWPNMLAIFMAANAAWVVPASHDERRYAFGEVSEARKQQKAYFDPLFAELAAGGAAAMLWDLRGMDLDGWHPRDAIPQTKGLREQKMYSLDGLDQWYVHKLGVGRLPWPSVKNPRQSLAAYLLEDCKEFSPPNRFVEPTEFGLFLAKRGCEHKSNGKKWTWVFPPLGECRRAWEAEAGAWEWLEPGLEDWQG
jgi:hypothetical protein